MILSELYRETVSLLKECDSPFLDAKLIIMKQLNLDEKGFLLESQREISEKECSEVMQMTQRRKNGTPVAYLIGHRSFWKSDFSTPQGVLIPQPDTETLVETVLSENIDKSELRILDLCAGTGCIGISLAQEFSEKGSNVRLVLSDISEQACSAAEENASRLLKECNVSYSIRKGNMFETVRGEKFDLIVSNPPYINSNLIESLPREVKAEPVLALDGGNDGLDFVRILAEKSLEFLNEGGLIAFEIGYDQGEKAMEIMKENGFDKVFVIKDICGCDRVVKCRF